MSDGRIDDQMIEISDPDEVPVGGEPPLKVVIEYRERGIPWMLIPPLLMLCAVGAILGYRKLAPQVNPPVPRVAGVAPSVTPPVIDSAVTPAGEPSKGDGSTTGQPPSTTPAVSVATSEPPAVPPQEKPVASTAISVEPEKPTLELPPVAAEKPTEADKPVESSTFTQVTGLGFDPKALEAEKKADAQNPPADSAIAPAARQEGAREPGLPAAADNQNLPREVDPEILPPDPKLARVRQKKRAVERASEAIQQVEADRVRFHNDLREICRISRADYLKEVVELSNRYGMQVDPKVKLLAQERLGKTGRYAGADRLTRIDVLRAVGFPEPLILEDVFKNYETQRIGERSGPRDENEAMHRAILFLLRFAPGQPASPSSRPTASRSVPAPPQPGPASRSNPGPR